MRSSRAPDELKLLAFKLSLRLVAINAGVVVVMSRERVHAQVVLTSLQSLQKAAGPKKFELVV